jgi:hypothetical protein
MINLHTDVSSRFRRLTLDRQQDVPRLCDIHCCGFRYSVYSLTAQFILYEQPRNARYYSTKPPTFEPDMSRNAAPSQLEDAFIQINGSVLVEQVLCSTPFLGMVHFIFSRRRFLPKPYCGFVLLRSHRIRLQTSQLGTSLRTEPLAGQLHCCVCDDHLHQLSRPLRQEKTRRRRTAGPQMTTHYPPLDRQLRRLVSDAASRMR